MLEIIAIIVLFICLFGMGLIMAGKIPALAKMPRTKKVSFKKNFISFFHLLRENMAKRNKFFHIAFYERFLEKTLSRIRILILRTDNKTSKLLQKLRENSQKNKER